MLTLFLRVFSNEYTSVVSSLSLSFTSCLVLHRCHEERILKEGLEGGDSKSLRAAKGQDTGED